MSGPTARLIDSRHPAWAELIARVPHDVYHLPAYAEVSAEHERGSARAVLVEDAGHSMLLPLVIRDLDGGATDATSPYGYPGPIGTDMHDGTFLTAAFAQTSEVLREAGSISLFVRFHPLINRVLPQSLGALVDHGETVVIDLERTPQEIWHGFRENHQRDIRRAIRAGVEAHIEATDDAFETFLDLYHATMSRLRASPYYRFGRAHFEALRAALGERIWLVVLRIQGEAAAAGLFFREAGVVQYHLSGSDTRFRSFQPTKLMIHAVAGWAREHGDRWFHLGGGVGSADDALFQFKAGFSSMRRRFVTLRLILDDAEYQRRVRLSGASSARVDASAYFPAYRRR